MLKVGIIGSGFGLYGLLPAFNSIQDCKVVSICGKKTERLEMYCKSIGLSKIYSDWKEMLDNEKLDAVAIAVIPSVQYEIAKYAIAKGLHIFAEKPLTANIKEAQELLLLAKKNNIITAVDFIFPEINEWQKAKELLDTKVYGKLKDISVTWNFLSYDIKNKIRSWKTDIQAGGGALSFYMSHVLYYLEYFCGKIIKTKSLFTYSNDSLNGAEVGVDMSLEFQNKITGEVHFSCNTPTLIHKVIFTCEKGIITLENTKDVIQSFILTISTKNTMQDVSIQKPKIKEGEDERVFVVKKLAARFVEGCLTQKAIIPSFIEGVRVQELIEQIRSEKA